jgi:hypothetical protein
LSFIYNNKAATPHLFSLSKLFITLFRKPTKFHPSNAERTKDLYKVQACVPKQFEKHALYQHSYSIPMDGHPYVD